MQGLQLCLEPSPNQAKAPRDGETLHARLANIMGKLLHSYCETVEL